MKEGTMRCPVKIDRAPRRGWSGDPLSRYVECEFYITFPKNYNMYDAMGTKTAARFARRLLQSHWDEDHEYADWEALTL